ncbi:MAG: hypothetical protein HRU36_01380 [Rickettsiales bacterium]|nr:hypothetical protein [Rickettsiales bacterium]
MFKITKKLAFIITFITSFLISNITFSEETKSLNSNLMFSSGITLNKIFDIHLGTVAGFSSPYIGFLSLDTSHNVMQESLSGVAHMGGSVSGKVAIDAPIGQTLSIWIQQPTVGSCGTGTLWGIPKCKVLESDDSTIALAETRCSSTDGVTVNITNSPHYLYVGGTLSFFYGHTCHVGADAVDNQNNATGTHIVHIAQQ